MLMVDNIHFGAYTFLGVFLKFRWYGSDIFHIRYSLNLMFDQVARVSDVVSVGQQVTVMCIGQDVRGNIKLSLKATLPLPRPQPDDVVDQPTPLVKEAPQIWAAVSDASSGQEDDNEESSVSSANRTEAPFVPSFVIRTAAECEEQEKSAKSAETSKSSKSVREYCYLIVAEMFVPLTIFC